MDYLNFIARTAIFGIPAFHFLATVDIGWFYGKPRVLVVVAFLGVAAAWFGSAWGMYALAGRITARFKAGKKISPALLRFFALGLMVPFVIAEGWALWRDRTPAPRRPDIYVAVMDAFRADRLKFYGGERCLAPVADDEPPTQQNDTDKQQ